eukprot:TRINITY_DN24940_c0_g1_i1.p1 TRINITY_DN24940_c0_g1~~TRINITY_DN24940_c0_g1_i1.p1  ORF type:complete len:216 (-),score=20.24 TRINITY_DN24940_c0_g1_i1:1323-1970(-)
MDGRHGFSGHVCVVSVLLLWLHSWSASLSWVASPRHSLLLVHGRHARLLTSRICCRRPGSEEFSLIYKRALQQDRDKATEEKCEGGHGCEVSSESNEAYRDGQLSPESQKAASRLEPGVWVFGADYCAACTRLCRRLEDLGLLSTAGATWRYVDAEIPGPTGEELFWKALAGAPFLPPLPVIVVIAEDGSIEARLDAADVKSLTDDELRDLDPTR